VVTLESAGVPETLSDEWRKAMTQALVEGTMLKREVTLEDVGNVAVFAASDWARTITATSLNITAGREAD
jgi:enoyl-[acyl-carrier-protein] reductase (NADH)